MKTIIEFLEPRKTFFNDLWAQRYFIISLMLIMLISFMLFFLNLATAWDINLNIIAQIESNNKPQAISYRGAEYGKGIYQISAVVLKEFNQDGRQFYNTPTLPSEALFKPELAERVADYYLNKKIPYYLRFYKLPDTLIYRLAGWNWGIGNVRKWHKKGAYWTQLPKETRDFIKKYRKLAISLIN